jgi:hypothetical protein
LESPLSPKLDEKQMNPDALILCGLCASMGNCFSRVNGFDTLYANPFNKTYSPVTNPKDFVLDRVQFNKTTSLINTCH